MTSGERALVSDRTRSAILELAPHVLGLLLFGIAFATVSSSLEAGIPRTICFDSSFTLSLVIALASVGFAVWLFLPSFLPAGRGRLCWNGIDSVGGFRRPSFVVVMTLA